MNGQTNVQLIAISTMLAVLALGIARYFAPAFVESLGASFPEIFTGGIIALLGYFLAPDAGFKALPGTGTDASSPALLGVLALVLAAIAMSGCAGTAAAYRAAEGLPETVYVVGEHYFAEVQAINDLAESGKITPDEVISLDRVSQDTRPSIVAMVSAGEAYDNVKSAENEAELSATLAVAAVALAKMVDAIKAIGGSTGLVECLEAAYETGAQRAVNYCNSFAA